MTYSLVVALIAILLSLIGLTFLSRRNVKTLARNDKGKKNRRFLVQALSIGGLVFGFFNLNFSYGVESGVPSFLAVVMVAGGLAVFVKTIGTALPAQLGQLSRLTATVAGRLLSPFAYVNKFISTITRTENENRFRNSAAIIGGLLFSIAAIASLSLALPNPVTDRALYAGMAQPILWVGAMIYGFMAISGFRAWVNMLLASLLLTIVSALIWMN